MRINVLNLGRTVMPYAQKLSLESLFKRQTLEPKLETFGMVIAISRLSYSGRVGKGLTLNNPGLGFAERELFRRIYKAAETMPTTRRVKIIDKKEFVAAALRKDCKTDEDDGVHSSHCGTDQGEQSSSCTIEKMTIDPS